MLGAERSAMFRMRNATDNLDLRSSMIVDANELFARGDRHRGCVGAPGWDCHKALSSARLPVTRDCVEFMGLASR